MPTIIMTKWPVKIDGSVRSKAMAFLQKLSADDTTPGLHVEPIQQSADPRVRTGRVDQSYRAVMFRLDGAGEPHYVIHGVWQHDDAIAVAKKVRLKLNPINGLPQIEEIPVPADAGGGGEHAAAGPGGERPVRSDEPQDKPAVDVRRDEVDTREEPVPTEPLLGRRGVTRSDLVERLGVPVEVADLALVAPDEDGVLAVAQHHEGWLGTMLIDLATGDSVDTVRERMEIAAAPEPSDDDEALLRSLRRPAAQMQFTFIEDQDELRRVIESGDFGAWRVFLHPDQRRYVERPTKGPFRLSGGAGTGKTVVVVHRTRALARARPDARMLVTTFTRNLADSLRDSLQQLDPGVPVAGGPGEAGVHVTGIDALAFAVLRSAGGPSLGAATQAVLGDERPELRGRTPEGRWRAVVEGTSTDLPPQLAHEAFLAAEYATVVLPNRVLTEEQYLRVRRPGRGTPLDRKRRAAVWELISRYRAQGRVDGTLDYPETAAVAAAYLEGAGGEPRRLADHVLVDEGQDLSPGHWQLLRALVEPGPDDLFIAEDSHQRIYGPRLVLSRYGINIVGRSRRLTLNYRTTAQNLRYAMGILEEGEYVDLENVPEETGYRSARSGPEPELVDVASLPAELDLIADRVRGWLGTAVPAETIAVLVHDRFQRERVVSGLAERRVEVRAVDREKPVAGRPLVMTMHRAKGMEFSKVVLVLGDPSATERRFAGLDEAERADAELRERSVEYVAATRARDELVVVRRD
ncbi:ATP-dependent helicase [Cellulomonas sp. APG4]|uniref:UvrD-helicase domain-containing protein n=1 Tax=Cellulomonas sp. APG4 TaxID=1538656 RepID=UPI00137A5DA4|nr:UvrD-helicase domain-containing protein [Cellulomonas sp. APG4]NCT90970.1 ATP-dependent helicase [Cellulomonas sp. APG4]